MITRRKKKSPLPLIIIIVVLAAAVFIAARLFSGPSEKSVSKAIDEVFLAPVEHTVQQTEPGMDIADYARLENDRKAASLDELILQKTKYKVVSTSKESCVIEVSAPDMKKIFADIMELELSDINNDAEFEYAKSGLMDYISARLQSGDYDVLKSTVTVPMNGKEPEMTYELTDAMYGGFLSMFDELITMEIGE